MATSARWARRTRRTPDWVARGRRCGRSTRFVALALLAATAAVASMLASPVAAQDDGAPIAVVEAEALRSATGAEMVPVRVSVTSRRAIEAALVVRAPFSNLTWELPLALAANNEVTQIVAVPVGGNWVGDVEAALVVDGQDVADTNVNGRVNYVNAVAALGLSTSGDDVQLTYDGGQASLTEVNDLAVLGAFDTLVASPAGLESLTETERTQLLGWIGSGKQLIVADSAGSIDALLPEQWRADGPLTLADTGIIRYAPTGWEGSIPPAPSAMIDLFAFNWFDASPRELINDGGFRVPGLGGIALLLLVYVLAAGPLAFVVLTARRRQTLAWVVIPALALLFTLGVFGLGRLFNAGRSDAYATIAEVGANGLTVRDTVLVASSGTQRIELPQGWYLQSTALAPGFQQGQSGAATIVSPSRTTTDVEFGIEAGSAGTAIVVGTDASVGQILRVTDLVVSDATLTGTVQNQTGVDLENAAVMVGERVEHLGGLAEAASVEFTLQLDDAAGPFALELRAWDVDPRVGQQFPGWNEQDNDAIVSGPTNGLTWLNWRARRYSAAVPDGVVTAVAWSRDLDYSVVDGRGRTAVVARAELPEPQGSVFPSQVRRLMFALAGQSGFGGGFGVDVVAPGGGESASIAQFIAPPGSDVSSLALEVPRSAQGAELWVADQGWRAFDLDDLVGTSLAVPDEAWIDGVLTVRYSVDQFWGGGSVEPELVVRTDRTAVLEFAPAGETPRRLGEDGFMGENFGVEFAEVILGVDHGDFVVEPDVEVSIDGEIFGTYDVARVDLLEGDDVDIRMSRLDGSLDPFLIVRGPDGEIVAENDDDGSSTNSWIRFVVDRNGTYEIEARPLVGGPATGTYNLRWTVFREAS